MHAVIYVYACTYVRTYIILTYVPTNIQTYYTYVYTIHTCYRIHMQVCTYVRIHTIEITLFIYQYLYTFFSEVSDYVNC
jgi:hypothetical protein